MAGSGTSHGEGGGKQRCGGTRCRQAPRGQQGPGCRLRVATGEANNAGYDNRRRHVAWGAERAADAGKWMGVGDVQVDRDPCQ